MKNFAYTEVVLTFFFLSIAYPGQHLNKDTASVKTEFVTDTAVTKKNISVTDSLFLGTDSASISRADTIKVDSIRIRFIPGMGQLLENIDTSGVFWQSNIIWTDAKYIGDLIWKLPGFFLRELGEAGQWGELSAYGLDARHVTFLLDGRPMNDPVTGTYNIYDIPLEFISNTEMLSGASSLIAANTPGTAINFLTRFYNSYKPMTKIRYVEHSRGTVLTDGIFTQNILRGLNLMIGFQRHVSKGRYLNAELDAWSVRTRIRYNLSKRINISLTDFYTTSSNGLNHGVDGSQSISIFDEMGTHVINEEALDKRTRRDVTLSAIAHLFSDSSSATQTSIYYSTLAREYWDYMDLKKIDDSTKSAFWGVRLQQQLSLPMLYFIAGGQWERRKSDSTRTLKYHVETEKSIFVQGELRIINSIVPFASLRSVSLNGENTLNKGAGVRFAIGDWLNIFCDMSWYDRFPAIQEKYWSDSTIIRNSDILKEQHTLSQAGLSINIGSGLKLNISVFDREVKNAVIYEPAATFYGSQAVLISNINELKSRGINGSVAWHWHQLEFLGVITMTRYEQSGATRTLIPDAIIGGELSYRYLFFDEKLDAKFGIRSRFFKGQQAMSFDPQMLAYIQDNQDIIGSSTVLDMFTVLKIGNAYVSLSWENILNTKYMLAPVYPMPGRHMRLGVNWIFME